MNPLGHPSLTLISIFPSFIEWTCTKIPQKNKQHIPRVNRSAHFDTVMTELKGIGNSEDKGMSFEYDNRGARLRLMSGVETV